MFFCILFNYTILRDTKVRKRERGEEGRGGEARCPFFRMGRKGMPSGPPPFPPPACPPP